MIVLRDYSGCTILKSAYAVEAVRVHKKVSVPGSAVCPVIGEIVANLLEPWPLKIILDDVLAGPVASRRPRRRLPLSEILLVLASEGRYWLRPRPAIFHMTSTASPRTP